MSTPVLSTALQTAIERAGAELRHVGGRGRLTAGVSLTGIELSIAQRGPWGSTFGGYAHKLWGGGYEAGARLQIGW